MVETSIDIVSLGAYTRVVGAVFRACLFSGDDLHYLQRVCSLTLLIMEGMRRRRFVVVAMEYFIYHNELVCLSHSSLCVTNYVSCERQITLIFRPPVCLILAGSRKFNLRV